VAKISVRAKNVSKRYRIGQKEGYHLLRETLATAFRSPLQVFSGGRSPDEVAKEAIWALDGVSFEIEAGEVVGIIGRNGAGKTTLLKILSRITVPTRGEVDLHGRVGALLEVGTGFHGELTGRENIYFNGAVLGMKKAEIDRNFDAIVAFAEVEKFLDTPVKHYSTGMHMRLGFSVAAHLEPEILLVDEVLAVGDAGFQRKCLSKMDEVGKAGRTVLLVSHNISSILRLCDRVILLERGGIAADGPPQEVATRYLSSGSGSPAERVWADIMQAPGDAVARLRAIRVLTDDGKMTEAVDVGDAFILEIEYWKLQQVRRAVPEFRLFNEEGVCLFTSSAFRRDSEEEVRSSASLVRARCRVPAHLLAEGRVFVQASVISYDYSSTVHALERDAVSLRVVDRSGADDIREHYGGRWPGVIRPKLQWNVSSEPLEGG
jgi:lipopolysaccharide transport system ATP-binding protein